MPHLHEDPDRTTSIGLTRFASEFLFAAVAANEASGHKGSEQHVAPVPVMFLLGQSIELSLKAYLLHRGISLRDLRVTYKHGLRRCHRKARELGLLNQYAPSGQELVALHLLDELYETKQLQYIVTGLRRIPPYKVLEGVALGFLYATAKEVGYPQNRLPSREG